MSKQEDTQTLRKVTGDNIKYLLRIDGSNQNKWGDRFGLKRNSVNNYINYKTLMPVWIAQKVCEHYKLDLGKFYGQPIGNSDVGLYQKKESRHLEVTPELSSQTISIDINSITKQELYEKLQKEKAKVKYLTEAIRNL